MRSAKEIVVKPIESAAANPFMAANHYSGKFVRNSQLHFGFYLDRRLEGVISLGPSLDKRKMLGLVKGTAWNGFLELNRMAFTDYLPRNSESRALGVVFRMIAQRYPAVKWIVSFADACQCGDGTIYRAAGFILTAIKRNKDVIRLADGKISHTMSVKTGRDRLDHFAKTGGASTVLSEPLEGFQIRYIKFLDPAWRARLAVKEIPFSEIMNRGAAMYRGERQRADHAGEASQVCAAGTTSGEGGASPTPPLQSAEAGRGA